SSVGEGSQCGLALICFTSVVPTVLCGGFHRFSLANQHHAARLELKFKRSEESGLLQTAENFIHCHLQAPCEVQDGSLAHSRTARPSCCFDGMFTVAAQAGAAPVTCRRPQSRAAIRSRGS